MGAAVAIPLIVSAAAAAASAGVKAAGDKASGDYSQAVANQNSLIATIAGGAAVQKGQYQASQVEGQGTRIIGKERAGFSAAGVDATAGSAMDVQAGTRMMSDIDAATIRSNAAREAWGYSAQGQNFQIQGGLAKQSADFSEASSIVGGVGQLGSSIAGQFK